MDAKDEFKCEYAKSGRSRCNHGCRKKINKEDLRLGIDEWVRKNSMMQDIGDNKYGLSQAQCAAHMIQDIFCRWRMCISIVDE